MIQKIVIALGALSATALIGGCGAHSADSSNETFTVYSDAPKMSLLDLGAPGSSLGDVYHFSASLRSKPGGPVTGELVGSKTLIKLADDAKVLAVDRKSLADVKQGVFVGITAMPQPDGSQKAVEIHIFPEALRGLGEGHRPWDFVSNSTMTNATVDTSVVSTDGQKLVVKYKDGEKTVFVTPTTEIATYVKKSVADLKPGQKIFIAATKPAGDGTLDAPNISFGDYAVWR